MIRASVSVTKRWGMPRRAPAFAAVQLDSDNTCDHQTRNFGAKMKKKKPKKEKAAYDPNAEANYEKGDKTLKAMLDFINAPMKVPPPISDEEKARREAVMKEYTIQSFNEHNRIRHDLNCKIIMKNHACNMLPRKSKLREMAFNVLDPEDEPDWMNPPYFKIPGALAPHEIKLAEDDPRYGIDME